MREAGTPRCSIERSATRRSKTTLHTTVEEENEVLQSDQGGLFPPIQPRIVSLVIGCRGVVVGETMMLRKVWCFPNGCPLLCDAGRQCCIV